MYEDASTKVRMNERESKAFSVKVGVRGVAGFFWLGGPLF